MDNVPVLPHDGCGNEDQPSEGLMGLSIEASSVSPKPSPSHNAEPDAVPNPGPGDTDQVRWEAAQHFVASAIKALVRVCRIDRETAARWIRTAAEAASEQTE